ncbi:MAG: response regulator [Myxococcales bacterium]
MVECRPQHVRILLAEDDDGHAELIVEHLRDVGITNPIRRFRDGDEVWQYLTDQNSSEGVDQHCLLLLDIRMPRLDGTEVLRRIKADETLRSLPVIMLTTTDDPREIERCYALGCNAYVTKPIEFAAFSEALRRLGLFLMVVRLPKGPGTEDSP